jgi:hypothetical protein
MGVLRKRVGALEDQFFATVFLAAGCSLWGACSLQQQLPEP